MFEVQEALEQQKMEFNRKVCHKSVTHSHTDLASHIAISLSALMCCMCQLGNHPFEALDKEVR